MSDNEDIEEIKTAMSMVFKLFGGCALILIVFIFAIAGAVKWLMA